MRRTKGHLAASAAIVVACMLFAVRAGADEPTPTAVELQFQRAFYLQLHQNDLSGAAREYQAVVNNSDAPASFRRDAQLRLAAIREDQAASNLARVMPGGLMFYAEFNGLGQQLAGALAATSPAIAGELSKLRGAAVGITRIEGSKISGLIAIDVGDSQFARGTLEAAVQSLRPNESIGACRTFDLGSAGCMALSRRLVLISSERELLAGAVGRLQDSQATSLASTGGLLQAKAIGPGGSVAAHFTGEQMAKAFGHSHESSSAGSNGLFDFQHLESGTLQLDLSEAGTGVRAQVSFTVGQKNELYSKVHTAPITNRALAHVPAGAALVVAMSVPPEVASSANELAGSNSQISSLLQQIVSNLDEVALFAMPQTFRLDNNTTVPEFGLVVVAKDQAKTVVQWNQIMFMAAMAAPKADQPRSDIVVDGKPVQIHRFKGAPPVAFGRFGEQALVIGTEQAVTAAMHDGPASPLAERLAGDTSKAAMLDLGRVASMLHTQFPAQVPQRAVSSLGNLRLLVLSEETPERMSIRAELNGMPPVQRLWSH